MNFLYVKAFESYRLTDRQTDIQTDSSYMEGVIKQNCQCVHMGYCISSPSDSKKNFKLWNYDIYLFIYLLSNRTQCTLPEKKIKIKNLNNNYKWKNKIAFWSNKADTVHPRMWVFSDAWSLPVTLQDGGHIIRSAVAENPMLHANIVARCFIEHELWPIEVLHCGIGYGF